MATKKTTKSKDAAAAEERPQVEVGTEIGSSGTNIFSGVIVEEYNPKLAGIAGMRVYDEMRKGDPTVKAALSAISLPIRKALWFVKPASDETADKEIADFVHKALFEYLEDTWDDFMRQALLMTAYGCMVFEQVYDFKEIDGKTRIVWKKFAPRLPRSIIAWQQQDGTPGITQTTLTKPTVSIPLEKLLIFVNEKEGDNWWGTSLLRAAYKPWYYKSTLELIDGIAHERTGLGLPFVKLSKGASPAEKSKAKTIVQNLRANEKQYLIEPDDYTVDFKDMKVSSTKDAGRAIAYHDRQIAKSVLAMFIDLGGGPNGTRSLSQDQTDLFLLSLEAIANGMADTISKAAIKQLVDFNFSGVTSYPKLDYTGIQRDDVDALTTSYQRLTQSGGIKARAVDEDYLRKTMGLPDVPEDEKAAEAGAAADKNEIDPNADPSKPAPPKKADERRRFAEQGDFKSWRKLTFAEKKVPFQSLQDFIDKNEDRLTADATAILKKAKDEYLTKLAKALHDGDTRGVADIELSYQNEYKAAIKKALQKAFEFGKGGAAKEMGVDAPSNPQDLMAALDLAADTITEDHFGQLKTEAKTAVADRLGRGQDATAAAAAASSAMDDLIDTVIPNMSSISVTGYINSGRKAAFDDNDSNIHGLQRSEILDSKTCNFCLSMDGRIIETDDPLAASGVFHSNCRGIWVEILNDEAELPDITGVPNSLRDRIGETVNEIVQPKTPIVKKDSLAAKKIAKGKAGKTGE